MVVQQEIQDIATAQAGEGAPTIASTPNPAAAARSKSKKRYNANCKVCRHAECDAISYALANGEPTAQTARRFNVSRTSLQRHRRNHIGAEAMAAARRRKILGDNRQRLDELREEESTGLLARLAMIRGRLNIALGKAEEVGDLRAVALLSAQIHKGAELIARLLGELQAPSTTVTVNSQSLTVGGDILELKKIVDETLRPWPAARAALLSALTDTTPKESPRMIDNG